MVHVQLFHGFHAHMLSTSSAFLFAETPSSLGLGVCVAPRPKMACLTVKSGFKSNEALQTQLLHSPSTPVCSATRSVAPDNPYDRAWNYNCSQWRFSVGDPFTSIAMHHPSTPRLTDQHSHWMLLYTSARNGLLTEESTHHYYFPNRTRRDGTSLPVQSGVAPHTHERARPWKSEVVGFTPVGRPAPNPYRRGGAGTAGGEGSWGGGKGGLRKGETP